MPLAVLALFYGPCIDSQLCKCNSLKQMALTFNAVRHGRLTGEKGRYNEMLQIYEISSLISGKFTFLLFFKQLDQVYIAVGSLLIQFSSIHYDLLVIPAA